MNTDLDFSWEPIEEMNINTKRWKMDVNQWEKGERVDCLYEDDLFLDHKSWNTWKYYDFLVNYYVGSCLC